MADVDSAGFLEQRIANRVREAQRRREEEDEDEEPTRLQRGLSTAKDVVQGAGRLAKGVYRQAQASEEPSAYRQKSDEEKDAIEGGILRTGYEVARDTTLGGLADVRDVAKGIYERNPYLVGGALAGAALGPAYRGGRAAVRGARRLMQGAPSPSSSIDSVMDTLPPRSMKEVDMQQRSSVSPEDEAELFRQAEESDRAAQAAADYDAEFGSPGSDGLTFDQRRAIRNADEDAPRSMSDVDIDERSATDAAEETRRFDEAEQADMAAQSRADMEAEFDPMREAEEITELPDVRDVARRSMQPEADDAGNVWDGAFGDGAIRPLEQAESDDLAWRLSQATGIRQDSVDFEKRMQEYGFYMDEQGAKLHMGLDSSVDHRDIESLIEAIEEGNDDLARRIKGKIDSNMFEGDTYGIHRGEMNQLDGMEEDLLQQELDFRRGTRKDPPDPELVENIRRWKASEAGDEEAYRIASDTRDLVRSLDAQNAPPELIDRAGVLYDELDRQLAMGEEAFDMSRINDIEDELKGIYKEFNVPHSEYNIDGLYDEFARQRKAKGLPPLKDQDPNF